MSTKRITYIFITLWLIVTYNSEWSNFSMPLIGVGINVVFEGLLLLLTLPTVFLRRNAYKIWAILLLLFWGASTTWSINPSSFDSYWKYSLPYVVALAISTIITSEQDVEKLLKINIMAAFLCGLYVLLFVNTGNLSVDRLGGSEEGRLWNANDIGIKMTIGYASSLYFMLTNNKNRILWYPFLGIFLLVSFFSGSKSVLILIVSFTTLLIIARSKGKRIVLYSIASVFLILGLFWAIMNVPALYDILGRRVELMITGLTGGDGGYSMDTRNMMIVNGISWFLERPWLGYGFNGYSTLYGQLTGWEVYSHSNIIEMLVNSGIIGFMLYYSLTFYILIKLWKPALERKDPLALILFLYTIIATVLDYVVISYVNVPYIVRLMYTAMYCQILKNGEVTVVEPRLKYKNKKFSS